MAVDTIYSSGKEGGLEDEAGTMALTVAGSVVQGQLVDEGGDKHNVLAYGIVPDCREVLTATCAAGNPVVTWAGTPMATADEGKVVGIGACLVGAIVSVDSATQVTLSMAADFSGSALLLTLNRGPSIATSDVLTVTDAVVTLGSAVVTSATAAFTASDKGRQVWVGTAQYHHTTIAEVVSATRVRLATPAPYNLGDGAGGNVLVLNLSRSPRRHISNAGLEQGGTSAWDVVVANGLSFTAGDVGREIILAIGCGTTVAQVNGPNTATLSVAPTFNLTDGGRLMWGSDNSAAIQALWDAVAQTGGIIRFPPGVYLASRLEVRPGVTLDLRGATLRNLPGRERFDRLMTCTKGKYYGGYVDSAPVVLEHGVLHGSRHYQGPYVMYERDQQGVAFFMADPCKPGRLRVEIDGTTAMETVADGFGFYANVDFVTRNTKDFNCFRGGHTVTGGNTVGEIVNMRSRGPVHCSGLQIEMDGPGYGVKETDENNVVIRDTGYKIDITVIGGLIDQTFDIGFKAGPASGSRVYVRGMRVLGGPWVIYAPGGEVECEGCYFALGAFSPTTNRIAHPQNVTLRRCVFEVRDASMMLGDTTGNVAGLRVYWNFGGTAYRDQRLRVLDCEFRLAPGVAPTGTSYGIYTESDVTSRDNRLIVEGGSITPGFSYGLYMTQGGIWRIKGIEIASPTAIWWSGAGANAADIEIDDVDPTGAGTAYMHINTHSASNSLLHRNLLLDESRAKITTTSGVTNNTYRGERVILGSVDPTASPTPGIKGDRWRLKNGVAGATYEWVATTTSVTGATWKRLTALST